jgi:hypothetical protein
MQAGKALSVRCIAAMGILWLTLSGCGGTDLSDYRHVQQSGSTVEKSEQLQTTGAKNDSTPSHNSDDDAPADQRMESLPVSALAPVNVVDGASVSMLLKVVPGKSDSAANPANSGVRPVSATSADAATATTDKPRTVEVLVPNKTFQKDPASKALRVSYDDLDLLKVLNLDPVTENAVDLMPAWLKGLNGQRIKIRGFMYPTYETEGLERFVLARDNQICCFGRDPKIYDLVQVDLRAGKTTRYIPATRAFDVIGTLKIEILSEDGKPFGLYFLEDAQVIDR